MHVGRRPIHSGRISVSCAFHYAVAFDAATRVGPLRPVSLNPPPLWRLASHSSGWCLQIAELNLPLATGDVASTAARHTTALTSRHHGRPPACRAVAAAIGHSFCTTSRMEASGTAMNPSRGGGANTRICQSLCHLAAN